VKRIALAVGLFLALLAYVAMGLAGWPFAPSFTGAVTVLCAVWWMTEAIPIPVTAFIPLSVLPLSGILQVSDVAGAFGNPISFLLLGGFLLSMALSRSGAHLRLAVGIIRLIRPETDRQLVLAFMAASAVISMWISNAATVLMLMPIALAILDKREAGSGEAFPALAVPLLLGLCYAANIGGMGTPIGTPPNLIFIEMYKQATGEEVGFLRWMAWGVPAVFCLLPVATWVMMRDLDKGVAPRIEAGGAWRPAERRALMLFATVALLWITRKDPFGGWSAWLGLSNANDGYVALLGAVFAFIIPDEKGEPLLEWRAARDLPWGVIVLVAGGLALSTALTSTGLTNALAAALGGLSTLPIVFLVFAICLAVSFITELTSNSASTALLLPILAGASAAAKVDPVLMMLPAALSASCAFMMPMATAPNAIIFSSERVPIAAMIKRGVTLNILCAIVLTGLLWVFFEKI